MKITVRRLLLLCIGMLTNSLVVSAQTEAVSAQTEAMDTQGQEAPPQERRMEAVSTAATPDYTAYIRPLDKLRSELSQQQALLQTAVDITTRLDQLRNLGSGSDILILLDEDLSQTERIRAVLSDKNHASPDELASIRAEVELLKSIVMQTRQQTAPSVVADAQAPWTPGASSIRYVQGADNATAGFVSILTGTGASVVLKAGQSVKITGKTVLLDSVEPGSDGHILIHFLVDGKLKTVRYPQ